MQFYVVSDLFIQGNYSVSVPPINSISFAWRMSDDLKKVPKELFKDLHPDNYLLSSKICIQRDLNLAILGEQHKVRC